MPKPEKVVNRNAMAKDGDHRSDPVAVAGSPNGVSGVSQLSAITESNSFAIAALCHFFQRDDGWLRVVPQDLGKVVYYKWKFTRGRWKNHYVMYRDDSFDPARAIQGLEDKVSDVDKGVRRPALDTPYD